MPAELRNHIYRLCLSNAKEDDNDVFVDEEELKIAPSIIIDENLKTPPLLSTCRQLRTECLKIYHQENKFVATVLNCNTRVLQAYLRNVLYPLDEECGEIWNCQTVSLTLSEIGVGCWPNLVDWCHEVWKGKLPLERIGLDGMDLFSWESETVHAALEIAEEGRSLSWEMVLSMLEKVRKSVAAYDGNWVVD